MIIRLLAASAAIALLASCAGAPGAGDAGKMTAEIRRTAYGVPHIKASDYAGLGLGLGYVSAEDNICEIAERMMTVNGERAKYLGRGENDFNVNSDLFHKRLIELIFGDGLHRDERITTFRIDQLPRESRNPRVRVGEHYYGWFGWQDDKPIEDLKVKFAQSTSDAEKKKLAEQIQLRAMETASHVPLGQYNNPAAVRQNVNGLVPGGAQVYWNIKKN